MKIAYCILLLIAVVYLAGKLIDNSFEYPEYIRIEFVNHSGVDIEHVSIKCFQSEVKIAGFSCIKNTKVIIQNISDQNQDLTIQVKLQSGVVLESPPVPFHNGQCGRVDVYHDKVLITKTKGTLGDL